MRFQQLKQNSNYVLKKKLIKSKKNWVVVSSLALAGGLFLAGSPSVTVKADDVNNNVPTTQTVQASNNTDQSNGSASQSDTDTTKDSTADSNQINNQPIIQATSLSSNDQGNGTDNQSQNNNQQNNVVAQPTSELSSAEKPATDNGTSGSTEGNAGDTGSTNTGDTNASSDFVIPSTDVMYSNDPDDASSTENNIGVKWYITKEGVLHIGPGEISNGSSQFGSSTKYANDPDNDNFGINRISIDGSVTAPSYLNSFFANLPYLTTIDNLQDFDVTKNGNDFSFMFANDPKLTSLDLSSWNTANANSMMNMFENDVSLKDLNVANFNISQVMDMSHMFDMNTDNKEGNDFGSLESLDLSGWSAVADGTDMTNMFANNSKLTSIKLPDISGAQTLKATFLNDKSLKGLDLSNWKTNPGVYIGQSPNDGMFDGTDFSYITLGAGNIFKDIDLPSSKSKTWNNTDTKADIKSFATTPAADSIGKYYNGTDNPTETYTFVPDLNADITADVTIHVSKDSQVKDDQVVTGVTGKIGQSVSVKVPVIDGYKADKDNVEAIVNPDGTITTNETVKYTKKSSGGSGSNTNNNNNNNNNGNGNQNTATVEYKDQTVATFNNEDNVPLYARNSDNTMSRIGNRALSRNSAWFSNKKLTINNVSYYQVATNEYVRADQVYPYQNVNIDIRTYAGSSKTLINANGETSNRALAANSDWFTDRIATINGDKYYRVSTGEFVSVNDAYIYQVLNN